MFNIKTLNKISKIGLSQLDGGNYKYGDEIENPDAIILRSFNMNEMEIPNTVNAIARAGAGVNNIPLDKCSEKGIVVFNTPGANANAVKELVIAGMLITSRKIVDGINWVTAQKDEGDNLSKAIEKGKSTFKGPEIAGKKLGVIGLGAIGVMVANAATDLEMEVIGYDPYISIDSAWGLSRNVKKTDSLKTIFEQCDYITIHVPLMDATKNMVGEESLKSVKPNVRILNFARGGLVDNDAIVKAINEGRVASYITDFPTVEMIDNPNVICVPHLGASTPESEENCAYMAAKELKDFLENGNIVNSVNFPRCKMERETEYRICIAHKNIPNMLGQISTLFANKGMNIAHMMNKSKGDNAYTMADVDSYNEEVIEHLAKIDGVLKVTVIK